MMKSSERAIKLIKKWEGLFLDAYYDSAGVLTIGYGTTTRADIGVNVRPGMRITKDQAEQYLQREVDKIEPKLNKLLKVKVTQTEYDALVVFIYNVGISAFIISTMLQLINRNDKEGAARQFMRWTMAFNTKTGKKEPIAGLVNRRKDEQALFMEKVQVAFPSEIDNNVVVASETQKANPSKVIKPSVNSNWWNEVWNSNTIRISLAGLYAQLMALSGSLPGLDTKYWLLGTLLVVVILICLVIWRRVIDARSRA